MAPVNRCSGALQSINHLFESGSKAHKTKQTHRQKNSGCHDGRLFLIFLVDFNLFLNWFYTSFPVFISSKIQYSITRERPPTICWHYLRTPRTTAFESVYCHHRVFTYCVQCCAWGRPL